MPRARSQIKLKLYRFSSNPDFDELVETGAVEGAREVDRIAREEGLSALDVSDPLVRIGCEFDGAGGVLKNGYGVFHLSWLSESNPQWAGRIREEIEEIRKTVRRAHGFTVKYLIWAGMGGSAEDKAFYLSAGLLKRRVRTYILDSTDPAKLAAILDHIAKTDKQPLEIALCKCLVVGMAMGMTSYEPVLNLEKLDLLYRKLHIPNEANFVYMTLPGSVLDRFGSERGFRRIELQPDGGNTTAGRHSGPLTRGSLYPLAFNGCDLESWISATQLSEAETRAAMQLAGFIQGCAREGRDKVTLHLPSEWSGGQIWTKQNFEESLGKSEEIGVKVAVGEKVRLVDYLPPKSPLQDRCFVFVQSPGLRNPDPNKIAALRRAGYPVALLTVEGEQALARYMQLIHYVVFGLGRLRGMNFVTQPGVELYKKFAWDLKLEAERKGGIENVAAWKALTRSPRRVKWRRGIALNLDPLLALGMVEEDVFKTENGNAAAVLASAIESLVESGKVSYGELTFFGDTRYNEAGKQVRRALDASADALFRSRLRMPADVYEGPAMNHSYHEMVIGYGRGFSIAILSDKQASIRKLDYGSDYHRAQWLATQQALAKRGRAVVALTLRDTGEASRQALQEFFIEVARRVKKRRG